jgi:hypothetical protein
MTAPANPWASDGSAQNVQPPDAYVALGFVDEEPISAAYLNWALSNIYGVNLCITHSTGSEICIDDAGNINIHSVDDLTITGDTQIITSSPLHRHLIDNAGGFWSVLGDNGGAGDGIITVQYTSGGDSYFTASAKEHSFKNPAGSATWLFIDEDVVSSGIGFYASAASPLHGARYGYTSQTVKIDLSPQCGGYNREVLRAFGSPPAHSFGYIDYYYSVVASQENYVRPIPFDLSGSQASIVWRIDTLKFSYWNTSANFTVIVNKMERTTGVITQVATSTTITPGGTAVWSAEQTITINEVADLDTYTYFIDLQLTTTNTQSAGQNQRYCDQAFKYITLSCTKYAAD